MRLLTVTVLTVGMCFLAGSVIGQQPVSSGVFTEAQAEAGRAAVNNTCARCHTPTLTGRKGDSGEQPPVTSLSAAYQKFIGPRGFVPTLVGKSFLSNWGYVTVGELIARLQESVNSFPPEGTDRETAVNVTAYILQMNGAQAGSQPLNRTNEIIVNSITR